MIHTLEPRRLLNATLDGSGLLTVNGSNAADTITISLIATDISVSIQPEGFLQPSRPRVLRASSCWPATATTR